MIIVFFVLIFQATTTKLTTFSNDSLGSVFNELNIEPYFAEVEEGKVILHCKIFLDKKKDSSISSLYDLIASSKNFNDVPPTRKRTTSPVEKPNPKDFFETTNQKRRITYIATKPYILFKNMVSKPVKMVCSLKKRIQSYFCDAK